MRALYSLNIFLYGIALRIASLFHAKAKLMVRGYKNLFADLQQKIGVDKKPVAWFHCASLGEFEQGRPLIESFRKENPEYKIVLTFFSPSGYEVRKNYSGADVISYLPLDTKTNAKKFIAIVKPSVAFFVKYEFWLNFLNELYKENIPHFLISAIFRPDQVFFKSYGGIFRDALKNYSWIFTQEEKSISLLKNAGIEHVSISGDTRFDRVIEIASVAKEIPIAEKFSGSDKKVIVAGSTWAGDEEILFPAMKNIFANGWKLIIAPHELGEAHLSSIEKLLKENKISENEIVRFSVSEINSIANAKVLIIDNIGMLSSLYRYGRIAYVGGGFGKNIHNILEAAVYGMPVIFGPNHEKFYEAKKLLELGGAVCVNNKSELEKLLNDFISDATLLEKKSKISGEFVHSGKGATKLILKKSGEFLNR